MRVLAYCWGISIAIRFLSQSIYSNLSSSAINTQTSSTYRATTLSTFETMKNLPYLFVAYGFGALSQVYSAKSISLVLGSLLLGLLFVQLIFGNRHQLHE